MKRSVAYLRGLWRDMHRMPGPVWLFGGWAVWELVVWAIGIVPAAAAGVTLSGAGIIALAAVTHLLPLAVLEALVRRRRFAVGFASLYAGLKALGVLIGLAAPALLPATAGLPAAWPLMALRLVVWSAFVVYLERSPAVAATFSPACRRRVPWWAMLAMVALLVMGAL